MARFLARKTGLVNAALHNARIWSRLLLSRRAADTDYGRYSDVCFESTNMNGAAMGRFLRGRKPDLVVLGQSGIVRPNLLEIPPLGTLNCHPARLPYYRGVDVVRWALWNGSDVAATLHYVDAGVDTGDVIRIREIPVHAGDEPADVERRAVDCTLEMLVEAVEECSRGKRLPASPQPRGAGKQYYLMPFWTRRELERNWPAIRQRLVSRGAA